MPFSFSSVNMRITLPCCAASHFDAVYGISASRADRRIVIPVRPRLAMEFRRNSRITTTKWSLFISAFTRFPKASRSTAFDRRRFNHTAALGWVAAVEATTLSAGDRLFSGKFDVLPTIMAGLLAVYLQRLISSKCLSTESSGAGWH
jgi:hypothetical protein